MMNDAGATVSKTQLTRSNHWAKKNRGFTLIELLMVLFIIGIIAAIAIPTYLNYSSRAKLSEALAIASPVRRAVDEYWAMYATLPSNNEDAGAAAPASYTGAVVASVSVLAGGVVNVQLDDPGLSNGQLLFSPQPSNSSLIWQCSSPDIAPALLPKSCR